MDFPPFSGPSTDYIARGKIPLFVSFLTLARGCTDHTSAESEIFMGSTMESAETRSAGRVIGRTSERFNSRESAHCAGY